MADDRNNCCLPIIRTNYVLIDGENVQPDSLAGLDAEHFKVLLFVGANQTKVSFDVAEAMQKLGARAQYVKISGNGPNALDFHIAFYVGHLAASDATAVFHIISKDTGFDPLIQHLKSRKIFAARSRAIEDIPLLKAANSNGLPEKIVVVVENLRNRGAGRPRTAKTLGGTISSLFQKKLSEKDISDLLEELQKLGFVVITDKKVSYALPEGDGKQ